MGEGVLNTEEQECRDVKRKFLFPNLRVLRAFVVNDFDGLNGMNTLKEF